MLWTTIDRIKESSLHGRALRLRALLENSFDRELIQFQREAAVSYRALFSADLYRLYCAAYDGETNDSGLVDFCSNVMLRGNEFYEMLLCNPDKFAEVPDSGVFNEDYGVNVGEIGRTILIERNGEEATDANFILEEMPILDGIWDGLKHCVGSLTFESDWRYLKDRMPRVFARYSPK